MVWRHFPAENPDHRLHLDLRELLAYSRRFNRLQGRGPEGNLHLHDQLAPGGRIGYLHIH